MEIGAVYLDIVNLVLAFGLEHSIPVKLTVNTPSFRSSGALLQIQAARLTVYQAYQSQNPLQVLKESLFEQHASSDAVVAALELIPQLWKLSSTSTDMMIGLAEIYTHLCLQTIQSEVHVFSLHNLAGILDILNANLEERQLLPDLLQLWTSLPWSPINPSLSDAILRVSGCIMASMTLQKSLPPSGLKRWGAMVADAGLDDKVSSSPFSV